MKKAMPLKELLPLLGMTVSAFIFNTSEFMPIGLLTDIAAAFHITEAQAGMLITAYSWVVTLLSLPLMILACRMDFKKLLLGTVGLFGICQILSAVSPNFTVLLLSRLGVACAHAIFWSIASPMAVRLVSEEHRSFALSMIVTGTSVAMIFGLPLGRMIGLTVGWRMTFASVAVVAFIVLFYMSALFPKLPGSQSFTLTQLPELFKNPVLMGLYGITFLFATAYYTGYSYIDPFLQQVAGMPAGLITLALTVFGVAGLLGSFLFSKFYDRMRYSFIQMALLGITLSLLLLSPASVSSWAVIALCVLWGICATAFNVAFQSETIKASSEAASAVAMSIFSGIFNLGIGCGTWLGGTVCTYGSIAWIGFAGGIVGVIAVVGFCLVLAPNMKRAK